jgi:dTDP-4-amino-4,6-dideoxygalactose transaminase
LSRKAIGVDFIDLKAQQRRIRKQIDVAIGRVLDHGAYILGPEVRQFEAELAAFGQSKLALSCANGTDAVVLPLMAWGVGPGDAVFCPAFTFAATAEVVPWTGATPVFVDILPDTYNLDPAHLEKAIAEVKARGELRPRAVIAVDLFGQPADYPKIAEICRREGLKLLSDSAQGFGCTLNGHHPLHWADATATSFFPAKPLGCYGDGGAVLTNDQADWDVMDSLRIHGKGADKYDNVRIGMNSRLDSIQAAVLLEKLKIFPEEIELRNVVAARYNDRLGGKVTVPAVIEGGVSVWAQYTIETDDPQGLAAHMKTKGVPTAAYYPKPLHQQTAYKDFPVATGALPVSDAAGPRVLSLPMHPYLDEDTQAQIIDAVRGFNG